MKKQIPYIKIVADGYDAHIYLEDQQSIKIANMILERVTKTPKPVQMYEGDKLLMKSDQESILQKCCNCGVWHEIDISAHPDLEIEFKMIEGEPDFSKYEAETRIEKATTEDSEGI